MNEGASSTAWTATLFAALGAAGVPLVSAALQTGCFADDGPLTASVVLFVPAGMAGVGAILGATARRQSAAAWAISSALLMPAAGYVLGAVVGLMCWASLEGVAMGARDGLAFGAGALAATAPVLPLIRRAMGARAGSLAARSRRAALGCGVALAIEAAVMLATVAPARFRVCMAEPTAWEAMLCLLPVGALLALASLALTIARATETRRALELAVEPSEGQARAWQQFDLGLGEGLYGPAPRDSEASESAPYRRTLTREAIVVGDPAAARRSLRTDVIAALACACGALAVPFALAVFAFAH